MSTRVIYHANCPDGFGAAWSVWRALGTEGVTYEPWQYGEPPPVPRTADEARETRIILVDFSFKRPEMMELLHSFASVLCLDHHKTAEAELAGLEGCEFDMNRSGAVMAWDYFHPNTSRPWLVDYVQDRDLWQWKLPGSKEVSAWIMAQPHDFQYWESLCLEGQEQAYARGMAIRLHVENYANSMAKQYRTGIVGGVTLPVVNAPMFNVSDVLHRLLEETEAAAVCAFWMRGDGRYQHSLRSPKDGLDVSEIARQYGGGGHHSAAGFESSKCEVNWEI